MKLYGSLQSRLMEAARQPTPEFGMAATITSYTDRFAGTVTHVGSEPRPMVGVREDKATPLFSGMTDCQRYEYERDPEGRLYLFRQDKRGKWREIRRNPETKRWIMVSGGLGLALGFRDKHHDFSF